MKWRTGIATTDKQAGSVAALGEMKIGSLSVDTAIMPNSNAAQPKNRGSQISNLNKATKRWWLRSQFTDPDHD